MLMSQAKALKGFRLGDVMVTHLGADYVVVRASDRRPLDRSAAFKRDFRLVGTESRHRIYAPSKELLAERARVADRG